jgi:hypothetical protein
MNENKFISVEELAERYNTSKFVVYEMIAKNYFPTDVILRLNRKILINIENLERFEADGGTAKFSKVA